MFLDADDDEQVEIERQTAIIESTERGLVHEDVLKHRFMFEAHFDDLVSVVGLEDDGANQANLFASSSSKFGRSVLPLWLGLDDIVYSEEDNQQVNVPHR